MNDEGLATAYGHHNQGRRAARKLEFHYQKSPLYRTIHVDGALGGPTARQFIAISFYSERPIIPRRNSRSIIKGDGADITLGAEVTEESLTGVMRQVELTAMLDLNAARELMVWLRKHIGFLEEAQDVPQELRLGEPVQGEDG